MHWENLDKLLAIVDREFGKQGFYHAGPGGETLSVQDGVMRTNCMDCLDRTNVVQSLLARRSMLVGFVMCSGSKFRLTLLFSEPEPAARRLFSSGAGELGLLRFKNIFF